MCKISGVEPVITQSELPQREHMVEPQLGSLRREDRFGSSLWRGQYRTEEQLRKVQTDENEHLIYFWNVLFFLLLTFRRAD